MDNEQQYSRLDTAFSKFLGQRTAFDKAEKASFESIVTDLSFQQSQGHSCISLTTAQQNLVLASGLVSNVLVTEVALKPLVLEQDRLYLQRYWFYENRLVEQLKNLLEQNFENDLAGLLDRYFVDLIDEIDWQREAAKKVLSQSFSIITGGPGTGKTTIVVKILALLQELAFKSGSFLHIALVAPTGKAAVRLQDSIGISKERLPCSEIVKQQIPEIVTTIHRLLGSQAPSPYFKHDSTLPLTYDLVVVDEASMVDLALMSKLVDALKTGSRLILLGDNDQLASVESGAVLADLTASLPDHTIELKKSYRFQAQIKALADAVNQQSSELAWQILESENTSVSLLESKLVDYIVRQYAQYFKLIKQGAEISEIFDTFNHFQVLCCHRYGENGVININKKVEQLLSHQDEINNYTQWYPGRPIIVTQNNPGLRLYNGDIGICLFDKELAKITVFFLRSNGSVKKVMPSRLNAAETVYAMTIHKAQGSEFEECLCVFPDETSPVLSKELIYTAITRAKKSVKIFAKKAVFSFALQRKVERLGGLGKKLQV